VAVFSCRKLPAEAPNGSANQKIFNCHFCFGLLLRSPAQTHVTTLHGNFHLLIVEKLDNFDFMAYQLFQKIKFNNLFFGEQLCYVKIFFKAIQI